ncbi:MAG: hypothetical protein ACE5F8_05265 [Woeseiaceae bacterium]
MASSDGRPKATPLIQFLSFDGCPLAEAALAALEAALETCGMNGKEYDLVDVLDPATPASLASWGSPTILVNGKDVTGQAPGDGVGCRVYDTSDQVPTVESIAAAIRRCVET